MAIHCSILAWRIPWTEEPGGLQPRGHRELDTTEHGGSDEKQGVMLLEALGNFWTIKANGVGFS